ncbi:MAG: isoprenyl transferase [Candidatus Omnitrophica bacterium]|nr:isoprenyl transferase [Candidatus Omnitrophota bacterium]
MDKNNLPQHIAIIMDGNGRWAKKHHLPKAMGHRYGAKTVDRITSHCAKLGIKALTLYSFSTENWKRPPAEIDALMNLLYEYLGKELKKLNKNNIRLKAIGDITALPERVKKKLEEVISKTSANTGMVLVLALNYGGRQEIIRACRNLAEKVKEGSIDINSISEDVFSRELYTKDIPDPDLLIRTSGELRVSNFLLWQISYSEFVATKMLWPDFKISDLDDAIEEYTARNRRFGAN